MVKIAHITDIHSGYSSGKRFTKEGINLRVQDGYDAFKEAVDQMIEEDVDICISAGDVFHNAHPDIRTIVNAQEQFRRLSEAGIPVYNITGNHDATDIRSDIPASRTLHEPNNNIFSYIEPYLVKEVLPGIQCHFLSHHAYTDQGETMKEIELIDGDINILVSHGSCYDTNMNMILHCAGEPREVVIPEDIMALPWDYTLLGHIHERGWIGSTDGLTDTSGRKQFYGGSLIRRGFSDGPCKLGRGWTLWNIDDKGNFTPEFFTVEQRPQIDCPTIDAKNLSPSEIEEKLVKQVEDIYNKYKDDEGNISDKNAPIVRQTTINLTSVQYVAVSWVKAHKYDKHFFTHSQKKVLEEKDIVSSNENLTPEELKARSKKDIVSDFSDWIETVHTEKDEFENKEAVTDKSKELLKKGQDTVLENG